MYLSYWGLKEKPFENTPDPRFMFYSEMHKKALLYLMYAVKENKGSALLTGEIGCGKTLLSNVLCKRLNPREYTCAIVSNPSLEWNDLVREIVSQFSIAADIPNKSGNLRGLKELLIENDERNRKSVLIIDDAQSIKKRDIYDELRLLLNMQKNNKFLLNLIFLGQPEIRRIFHSIPQLDQRIGIRAHLSVFSHDETSQYIAHRLKTAGMVNPIFKEEAIAKIYRYSNGIPRKINMICDLILMKNAGDLLEKNYDITSPLTTGGMMEDGIFDQGVLDEISVYLKDETYPESDSTQNSSAGHTPAVPPKTAAQRSDEDIIRTNIISQNVGSLEGELSDMTLPPEIARADISGQTAVSPSAPTPGENVQKTENTKENNVVTPNDGRTGAVVFDDKMPPPTARMEPTGQTAVQPPTPSPGESTQKVEESPKEPKSEPAAQAPEVRQKQDEEVETKIAKRIIAELLQSLEKIFADRGENLETSVGQLLEPVDALIKTCRTSNAILRKALSLKQKGSFASHSINSAIIAVKVGIARKYNDEELTLLALSALLCDIGMTRIDQRIINKEGELSSAEFKHIKEHVKFSSEITSHLSEMYPKLPLIVSMVHERENGSGYPRGLKGDEIHEHARIIGLCDSYEALTEIRGYRDKYSGYGALQRIISSRGTHFNARIVKSLVDVVSVFPLESLVKLNNGAIGRVVDISPKHPTRPKLKILVNGDGVKLQNQVLLNLENEPLLYVEDPEIEEGRVL